MVHVVRHQFDSYRSVVENLSPHRYIYFVYSIFFEKQLTPLQKVHTVSWIIMTWFVERGIVGFLEPCRGIHNGLLLRKLLMGCGWEYPPCKNIICTSCCAVCYFLNTIPLFEMENNELSQNSVKIDWLELWCDKAFVHPLLETFFPCFPCTNGSY